MNEEILKLKILELAKDGISRNYAPVNIADIYNITDSTERKPFKVKIAILMDKLLLEGKLIKRDSIYYLA